MSLSEKKFWLTIEILCIVLAFLFVFPQISFAALFTVDTNNPALSYSAIPGSFDENQIRSPKVLKVDGVYMMYYGGLGSSNQISIGLATSNDGITWTRHPNNPVFKCGDNTLIDCPGGSESWSSWGVVNPHVLYLDGVYHMFYFGDQENGPSLNYLGYATSNDGVNWVAYEENPVFPEESLPLNGFQIYGMVENEGVFMLYYRKEASDTAPTYLATSVDGIHWDVQNNGLPIESNYLTPFGVYGGNIFAMNAGRLKKSVDGIVFTAVSEEPLIASEADVSGWMLVENNVVKLWKETYVGNINWGGGNSVAEYLTAPVSILGNGSEVDPTPIEQAEELIEYVLNLNLPKNVVNTYMANLQKVAEFIQQGKIQAAINQLDAFINKVNQDYAQGKLTQSERDNLVEAAEELIEDIN